jgi:hypothetical protein
MPSEPASGGALPLQWAFKEWAAICRALVQGRQRLILRKGGIREPGGSFRIEHSEFLLLPTFVHQSPESLKPEARDLLQEIDADRPPLGTVVFQHWARVTKAAEVRSLAELERLREEHVWSDEVVAERFHRWEELLHVLYVEVATLPQPISRPWDESYGGCRSWARLTVPVDCVETLPGR